MAKLKDRKRDYYATVQSVRDEAAVPEHLDTAGDVLIRDLARKQMTTETSLAEQLQVRQEFEVGATVQPWARCGLSSLREFEAEGDEEVAVAVGVSSEERSGDQMERIRARSGLTRRELELGLVEKPNSQTAALYRFALGNRARATRQESDVRSAMPGHPIHHLKEIEAEMASGCGGDDKAVDSVGTRKRKRRRRRRRPKGKKRKGPEGEERGHDDDGDDGSDESSSEVDCEVGDEVKSYRPSLWDVRDVRSVCRTEERGCQDKPTHYTMRDGAIVRLDQAQESAEETLGR